MREYLLVTYNLKKQSKSNKVRFSYALLGRTKKEGVLRKIKGKYLGKGVILIPSKFNKEVKELFDFWKIKFNAEKVYKSA